MKVRRCGISSPKALPAWWMCGFSLALAALSACGKANDSNGGSSDTPGGGSSSSGGGGSGGVPLGDASPPWVDAGSSCGLLCFDATTPTPEAGPAADATTAPPAGGLVSVSKTLTAPDCAGCTFPTATASPCAGAPAIKLVYPPDTVLLPPNLNLLSVQWTPFGAPFTRYEVDFEQTVGPATTDVRVVTACGAQTTDMQTCQGNCTSNPPAVSGGCELTVDPAVWSWLVQANRGGTNPVSVTVRGTTDGSCASTSGNTVHINFAEEDLLGTYYYWKSTIDTAGTGGQIWAKVFGDLNQTEQDVTSKAINATCNGCHSLSRDGSRMVVYSDDNDSDDEYSDLAGSELDMTPLFANPAKELDGGVTRGGFSGGGQPPGFTAVNPQATSYITSNGIPCTATSGRCPGVGFGSNGYGAQVPTNGFSLWNAVNGTFAGGVMVGPAGQRPTMPDWSIDGKTVIYVQPAGNYQSIQPTGTGWRSDDAHIYGGSLYTVPYAGNGTFGAPTAFLQSSGENNYYPSFSPDDPMSFVIFDRVDDMNAHGACSGSMNAAGFCPEDSFSNPAARLMLLGANSAGGTPIDLEKANGSSASAKIPLSNSYPRWAPFVQSYHGNKILWFTFSSTRDYGVRILNGKTGLVQCYPADSAEWPGGMHGGMFAANCKEPQLWMAPITFTEAQSATMDPSGAAFWIPYQDMTTHNHTAQWTWIPNPPPPPPDAGGPPPCTCSMVYGPCGAANGGCGCCDGHDLVCTGSGQCINPPN